MTTPTDKDVLAGLRATTEADADVRWADAMAKSQRVLATYRGEDPDEAEANYRAEAAARADLPREREVDDSGFESREDRERDALGGWGAGEDRALTEYERSRGR